MEQSKSAGAVMYYSDSGKVYFLLLKYPTYWGFAKGWIEENESEEQAAVREIGEETGLKDVKIIPGFRHEQRWMFRFEGRMINRYAAYFLVKVSKEEAVRTKISDEHEDFAWLVYEDAIKKMRVKQNREMLANALEFVKNMDKQKKLF